MDLYSGLALGAMLCTLLAMWKLRKRKEYQYSTLDISGIILNVVLILMIYPPLAVVGALLGMDRYATEPLKIFLEGLAIGMGRLMPAVSVAGIGASVILRRKEKRGLSFLVQFAGAAWFCITILFAVLCGSYC